MKSKKTYILLMNVFIYVTLTVIFFLAVRSYPVPSSQRESNIAPTNLLTMSKEQPDKPQAASLVVDWPQVQNNPQHTGYSTETLGSTIKVKWTHPFQPEKIYPQVQPIVYAGNVYVGSEMGNLYSLDSQTGVVKWVFAAGGPIMNSVAAVNGNIFFGCMDGAVYSINASSGQLVWKSSILRRVGFSTAPVFADGKIMLGGRDGVFYAINPLNGTILWQYEVNSPILQTAAWNSGRIIFGAMDMRVYALNSNNGTLAWKSVQLSGRAFNDYWPVIYGGKVIIRPTPALPYPGIMPGFPFAWYSTVSDWNWLSQNSAQIAAGNLTAVSAAMTAQDFIMAAYANNPTGFTKTLYILDETTGTELFAVPHWSNQTMNGATTPPCIDRDGMLVVPVTFIKSAWGRLDLNTKRIVDVLYDGFDYSGNPVNSINTRPAGMGNVDENLNLTCSANMIFAMHTEEGNANYTGAFNLNSRRWIPFSQGPSNKQMSTNTQGGGGNPASIANGWIYHISMHELIARQALP